MENFYMKYETAFLSNYELNELLPLLNKWKENLNEEKNSIENMTNAKRFFTFIPPVTSIYLFIIFLFYLLFYFIYYI